MIANFDNMFQLSLDLRFDYRSVSVCRCLALLSPTRRSTDESERTTESTSFGDPRVIEAVVLPRFMGSRRPDGSNYDQAKIIRQ